MDYFSRKPDFPTFEDIYIARAQGAIGLERREDGLACRFGQDGPAIMLPQVASQGDGVRGHAVCDDIVGALKEDPETRPAAAGCLDSYFTEVAERAPVGETCGSDCLFACHVDIDGVYAQRTGDPDGLRAYCDPIGVGWNYGPIYYFPHESVEQIVGQLCEDGDDFPILFFRERHSKTRPIVCLETGGTFMGNPAAARPLHVSPTAISQAVRYGSPVNGLHFYHGDEPKPAPEFFKPAKVKSDKSPAAIAAAAKAAAGNSAPGTDYREHGIQRDRRAVQ